MKIVGYVIRPFVVFAFGAASFLMLLFALACIALLLSVGLACALFTAWALVHLAIYLMLHDRAAGHASVQALTIAAACFGFLVLTFRSTADLFNFARKKSHGKPLVGDAPVATVNPGLRRKVGLLTTTVALDCGETAKAPNRRIAVKHAPVRFSLPVGETTAGSTKVI